MPKLKDIIKYFLLIEKTRKEIYKGIVDEYIIKIALAIYNKAT